MKHIPYKTYLPENKMPDAWYNVRFHMKEQPSPMIHPGTGCPMELKDIASVFVEALCRQELDKTTEYISIPGQVIDYYKTYRPSPLCRAYHFIIYNC